MLGLAVLGFLLLWLFAILLAMFIGWKIGKHFKYPIWGRLLGMALGFYATVGWYITQEAKEYYREKRLVTEFCQKYPRYEVFVSPEELKKITPDNAKQYDKYHYIELDNIGDTIQFNGTVYRQPLSIRENIKKNNEILSYSNFSKVGHSSLNMSLYVDGKYKLALYSDNRATSSSENDGGKFLGLKFWFNNIQGCERSVQELRVLDKQYISVYQGKKYVKQI